MNFYNYNRILSYNIPVNVLVGERGVGKSYGAKKFVIDQFKKHKHQFLYLRRYEKELEEVFKKDSSGKDFFTDIRKNYGDVELKTKGRKFYYDGEVFGYAYRFTQIQDLKSSSGWDNIKTIIIDEYAIEKNRRYYLPDEGMILMSAFDSILRQRSDVRIFILMNAVEGLEFSPLFSFFELSLPFNNDIKLFKDNTILVQYMNNEEYRKERENTLIRKTFKRNKI